MALRVRSATPADAAALLAIYAPMVESTAISSNSHHPLFKSSAPASRKPSPSGPGWWLSRRASVLRMRMLRPIVSARCTSGRWRPRPTSPLQLVAKASVLCCTANSSLHWPAGVTATPLRVSRFQTPQVSRCITPLGFLPLVSSRPLVESSALGMMSRGFRSSCGTNHRGISTYGVSSAV